MNIKKIVLLSLTFSLSIFTGTALAFSDSPDSSYPLSPSQAVPTLAPMLKNVLPSVVNISTQGIVAIQQHPQMNNPYFRRFAPRA